MSDELENQSPTDEIRAACKRSTNLNDEIVAVINRAETVGVGADDVLENLAAIAAWYLKVTNLSLADVATRTKAQELQDKANEFISNFVSELEGHLGEFGFTVDHCVEEVEITVDDEDEEEDEWEEDEDEEEEEEDDQK